MIADSDTFNLMIGRLDRILSEMLYMAKSDPDVINWQTLKHHAEDMEAAAKKIMELYEKRVK